MLFAYSPLPPTQAHNKHVCSVKCARSSEHPRCPSELALAISLNKNKIPQSILHHDEAQHYGSGEVELEDAVAPCTFLTHAYENGHHARTTKMKIVETHLDTLDSAWSQGQVSTSKTERPTVGE